MEFQLFLSFAIISMWMLQAHGAEPSSEVAYWKMNVGNDVTMPKIVMESLLGSTNGQGRYKMFSCAVHMEVYEPRVLGPRLDQSPLLPNAQGSKLPTYNTVQFFLEENLIHPGSKMKLSFIMGATDAKFKSSKEANSLPFSSNKLSEILQLFAIKPKSKIANLIDETLWFCEHKPVKGEQKYCATSLEAMVSYVKSNLGDRVNVLSTRVDKEAIEEYEIGRSKKIKIKKNLVCHKMVYPFTVFYCHTFSKTDVYEVSLIDSTGKKGMAMAVCHKDTSHWYPGYAAFQLLKVKPGSVPICHFLHPNAIIWVTE